MSEPGPAAKAIRPRPARLHVSDVTARFGDDVGAVVNISLGGVLLKLTRPLKAGDEGRLVLLKGPAIITVRATVLRRTLTAGADDSPDVWLVALKFAAPHTELRPLLAQLLYPTPIHELTHWSPAPPPGAQQMASPLDDPRRLQRMR